MTKKVNEGLAELAGVVDQDHEVQMARADLYKIAKYAIKLHEMLKNVTEAEGIEGWQQAKITKAADYIGSVYHSLEYDQKVMPESRQFRSTMNESEKAEYKAVLEKAVSKSQQRAAGIALAAKKKGETPKGKGAATDMAKMSTKELEKFAGTKHKGLPKKKTSESLNRQAKRILGEGKEYQVYLQLSEAPASDVVNKIKSGLAKMPKRAAAKATSLIKKVPKSAWPIAAGILATIIGPDAAQAQVQVDMDAFNAAMERLQQLSDRFNSDASDMAQRMGTGQAADVAQGSGQAADVAQGSGQAADVAQGSVGLPAGITRDQIVNLYNQLGGGTQLTLADLIQNDVDVDAVKRILDRFNMTDELRISMALQQIDGTDLGPMIRWLGQYR
jgi:5'-deoxynucleotidase YfbR-like HD superfamily hydrolase